MGVPQSVCAPFYCILQRTSGSIDGVLWLSRTRPLKGGVLALCLTWQEQRLLSSHSNNEIIIWDATVPEVIAEFLFVGLVMAIL